MENINNKKNDKFKKIFIEPTEEFVSSIGKTYIKSYLTDGSLFKGFAIVSNKRVYFKGSCYEREGKECRKINEERIVDLSDITGTGYKIIMQKWKIHVAIILFIYFIIAFPIAITTGDNELSMF